MLPVEVIPGLFRWTAPHPDWKSDAAPESGDDWEQMVGCALYEVPEALVLIDPLIPATEREAFLAWLDDRVAGRAVSVLTTIRWHRRDRELLAARYDANSSRAWNAVPSGVTPKPLRGAGETMFWLPDVAALVCGDRLLGDPDAGARLCPESWLSRVRVDRAGLAEIMRPLLELPIERLLLSHGDPVLRDGRAALARALAEAQAG